MSDPARLVLSHTMLQIKYRIAFLGVLFIFGRGVDYATTETLLAFGIVSAGTHLPMRHILHTIIITLFSFGHFNAACHTAASEESATHRVYDRETVHKQEVIVETYH